MAVNEFLLPPIATVDPVSRQHWLLLGAAYVALGLAAFAASQWVDDIGWAVHGWWCVLVMLFGVPAVILGIRAGVGTFLVDHRFMFLVAYLAYFSFGAALPAFGSEESVEAALSFYPVTPQDALWVDGFNGCGMGIALVVATLLNFSRTAVVTRSIALRLSQISMAPILIGMLITGLVAANYVLAIDLGMLDDTPSVFVRLAPRLSWVAILLAAAVRSRDSGLLKLLAAITALLLSLVGLLQFNKSESLYPLCAFMMGVAWSRQSARYLLTGVGLMVISFSLLGDLTATGRYLLQQTDARTLASRVELLILSQKLVSSGSIDQRYLGWVRICYVSPQVGAVDMYDAGKGGDGFASLPWVFVPRMIYPDKPEMTKGGRDFTEKINGNNQSSTGTGVFTSGYYHGGVWGWVFAAVAAGFSIRFLSVISAEIFKAGAVLLAPIAMMGVLGAFRVDGDVVTDHVSTAVMVGYALVAGWLLLLFGRVQPFEVEITKVQGQR